MIAYTEFGNFKQPVLVLLHGAGCYHTFCHQYELLSPHFRIILPYLPGSGPSATIEYDPESTLFSLTELLDTFSDRPLYLMGHSIGAELAAGLLCLQKHPIQKAVLLSPWLLASESSRRQYVQMAQMSFSMLQTEWLLRLQGRYWGMTPEQCAELVASARSLPRRTYQAYFERRITLALPKDKSFSVSSDSPMRYWLQNFPEVNAPVLALCGRYESRESRASIAALADSNKNCRGSILPYGSHDFPLKQWEKVNPLLLHFLLE